ncbi:MAG: leucine-rich repeat domain-containing protein [Flexilinea sp.]|nr:leucine-rich repeat domain-containing protein [Flexilinea sp.]
MKKLVIFIIIPFLFFLSQIGWAQEGTFSFGTWDAVENSSGLTLTAYYGNEAEVTIPEVLGGKPVTGLGKELFKDHINLQKVYIHDGITAIGANAFNGCVSLTDIRLPLNLKKIDTGTFRYCFHLENIFIPFSVTSVNGYAFADCVSLREINLVSATFIGESAFDNCQSLRSVNLSRKLTDIGGHAFRDTPWLNAQKDEYVIIGDGILVKYNGDAKLVNIPAGVTLISGAFEGNHQVKSVFLPDTLKKIGAYSFKNAENLRIVKISEFVTAIESMAFDGCRNLIEINIPYRVNTIGKNAFRDCEQLKKVYLPSSLKKINEGVFANCTSLQELLIPAAVTEIHQKALSGVEKVTLLVDQGSAAEQFAIENNIPVSYDILQSDSFLYKTDDSGIHIQRYIGKSNDVWIPSEIDGTTVVEIGSGAFQLNNRVHSVIVPLGVKSIGSWAFSYMDSLEYVELPISLTKIDSHAFSGSGELKEMILPDHLEEIGENAFDSGNQITLYAGEGSQTAMLLSGLDMEFSPSESLAPFADDEIAAIQKMLSNISLSDDSTVTAEDAVEDSDAETTEEGNITDEITGSIYSDFQILRIPDDRTTLTADLLENANKDLILIIPDAVNLIEEEILEEHDVLIVGNRESTAEEFAGKHHLPFMVRFNYILQIPGKIK